MDKIKGKKGVILKAVAALLYTLSVICICAGIVAMNSTTTNDFESKETVNNNLTKTVSTKDLMASFQNIEARRKAEAKAKAIKIAKAKAKKAEKEAQKAMKLGKTVPKSELQRYAHSLVINKYGWSESDFSGLVKLWNRESGWNPHSHNRYTGAHGIPQALPGSKMASAGSDYYNNGKTQIRWGLKYIKNKYGTAGRAWAFFQNNGWY